MQRKLYVSDTARKFNQGWIGVDLDSTLAFYDYWRGPSHIGHPITKMQNRVKAWVSSGRDVRIFTARVFPLGLVSVGADVSNITELSSLDAVKAVVAIRAWCTEHVGVPLPITCCKDNMMLELWDDRCIQVAPNSGERVDGSSQ